MAAKGANVDAAGGQGAPRVLPLTNDTFPAGMHIAAIRVLVAGLLPPLARLREDGTGPGGAPAGQA
jgi:hypothetical protein